MRFCMSHVTNVARSITNATAADIPREVFTFWLTPRNGQMPRNCDRTILLTNIAAININMYSIVGYAFLKRLMIAMIYPNVRNAPGGRMNIKRL